MKNFNKCTSLFLFLCTLFTQNSLAFTDKTAPSVLPQENSFETIFKDEKSSDAVLKYFLGPKANMSDYWANIIKKVFIDYCNMRKSFASDDTLEKNNINLDENFEKLLQELKDSLLRNHPYYSPRYMAHMLSEQSIPSVVGYFLGLLYNTNNSTAEASPVSTVLEAEYCKNIAKMFGYNTEKDKSNLKKAVSWTHLTSGGSVANLEALWISRYVHYAPLLIWDILNNFKLNENEIWPDQLSEISYVANMSILDILRMPPQEKTNIFKTFFDYFCSLEQNEFQKRLDKFIKSSDFNVKENGINRCNNAIEKLHGRPIKPLYFVPYTAHYCFPKILGMIGEGASSIIKIPVDENFRSDMQALKNITTKKLFENNDPCDYYISCVIAVTGTTEEGAVDPVDKILDFREELEKGKFGNKASFWLHIDGAWGGFFKTILGISNDLKDNRYFKNYKYLNNLSFEEKEQINAVNRTYLRFKDADSITIDPHKMGYVPYSAGAISFKNRDALILIKQLASYINEVKIDKNKAIDSLSDLDNIKAFSPYVFECSKSGAAATSCWFAEKLMPYNFDKNNPNADYHGDIIFDSYKAARQLHHYLINFNKIYQSKIDKLKNNKENLKSIVNLNKDTGVGAFGLIPISKTMDTNLVCFVAVPRDYDEVSGRVLPGPCRKINGKDATPEQLVDYTIDINNKLYKKYSYEDNTSKTNDPQKYNYFLSKTDFSFYTQNAETSDDSISEIYNNSYDIISFISKELAIEDPNLKEKLRKNLKILRATIMNPWHNNVKITNNRNVNSNLICGMLDDIQKEMVSIISEKYN